MQFQIKLSLRQTNQIQAGGVETSSLYQVGQKLKWQPGPVIGIWNGGGDAILWDQTLHLCDLMLSLGK